MHELDGRELGAALGGTLVGGTAQVVTQVVVGSTSAGE